MDNNVNEPQNEFGYKPRLEFDNHTDTTMLWFVAAVLFAVIAAGVIIYRSANADFRTAANDVAVRTAEIPPPAYSHIHIEGIDP